MGVHFITGSTGTGKTTELRAMLAALAVRKDVELDRDGNVSMRGYDFLTTPGLFNPDAEAAPPSKLMAWYMTHVQRREPRFGKIAGFFTKDPGTYSVNAEGERVRTGHGDISKATIDTFTTVEELLNWRPREGRRGIVMPDEFHLIYNNREWEDNRTDMASWVSQHRHLRLDLVCALQDQSRSDKNIRLLEPRFYRTERISDRRLLMAEYTYDVDLTTNEILEHRPLKRFWLWTPWPMRDAPLVFGRWEMFKNVWKWGMTAGDTYKSVAPPEDRLRRTRPRSSGTPSGPPPSRSADVRTKPLF